jgi:uncharacterized protein YjbI with pentapeptide repeats
LIQQPRIGRDGIDLSNAALTNSDIRGADLKNANLSGAVFTSVIMDGCDLGGNVRFDQADLYATAWWRARRMSLPLILYLGGIEPFSPLVTYPGPTKETAEEYTSNLNRLRTSANEP